MVLILFHLREYRFLARDGHFSEYGTSQASENDSDDSHLFHTWKLRKRVLSLAAELRTAGAAPPDSRHRRFWRSCLPGP
jgi:hypothetical protein